MRCPNCGKTLIFRMKLSGSGLDEFETKTSCVHCKKQWWLNWVKLPDMTMQECLDASYLAEAQNKFHDSLRPSKNEETEE